MSLENLTNNYREILTNLGEQPQRDGLKGTPERAATPNHWMRSSTARCLTPTTTRW